MDGRICSASILRLHIFQGVAERRPLCPGVPDFQFPLSRTFCNAQSAGLGSLVVLDFPSFAHHLPHFFWRPNHTKSTCRTSLSHAPCLKTSAVLRWWSSETGSGLRHLGCISPFTNLMVRRKGRIMGNPSWFSGMVWSQGMGFFCDFSLLFPCWFAKLRTSKKLPMLLYRCHLTVLCWCFDRISHFFFENWFDFTGILGWEHQGFLEIFPSTNLLMACSIIFSVVPQIITLW